MRGRPQVWREPAIRELELRAEPLTWAELHKSIQADCPTSASDPLMSMKASLTASEEFATVRVDGQSAVGLSAWYGKPEYWHELASAMASGRGVPLGRPIASQIPACIRDMSKLDLQAGLRDLQALSTAALDAEDRRWLREAITYFESRLDSLESEGKPASLDEDTLFRRRTEERIENLSRDLSRLVEVLGVPLEEDETQQMAWVENATRQVQEAADAKIAKSVADYLAQIIKDSAEARAGADFAKQMAQDAIQQVTQIEVKRSSRWAIIIGASSLVIAAVLAFISIFVMLLQLKAG